MRQGNLHLNSAVYNRPFPSNLSPFSMQAQFIEGMANRCSVVTFVSLLFPWISVHGNGNGKETHMWEINTLNPLRGSNFHAQSVKKAEEIPAANLPPTEINALQALYNATKGDHWRWFHFERSGIPWQFTSTCNPCVDHWQGVNCTNLSADGYLHVSELELSFHNLSGSLPAVLANLQYVWLLVMTENHITGFIPASLGGLQELIHLNLEGNHLSGTIPAELGNLPRIRQLSLYDNFLTGSIPVELADLQTLSTLNLYLNLLTGEIPPELGTLSASEFTELNLYYNDLTGTIPSELGNLRALTYMALHDNHLTGTIPAELGCLAVIENMYLGPNLLEGGLPAELGNLQQLQEFVAVRTHLTGSIPPSFGNLTSLTYLGLDNNMLTYSVPASCSQLSNLGSLFLQNNKLSGSIAPFINPDMLISLSVMQINNNRFTGQIPAVLFELPQLSTIILGDNCFTGSLPTAICTAPQLTTLSMDGLHSAPSCRHRLFPGTTLHAFVLTDYIEDGIPTCLFEMPKLNTLHLSGNGLLGSLPDNVSISANLVDLALSYNKLTGSIPTVFQDRIWYNFDLSYNKFSGTLSKDFATVPGNLSVMSLLGVSVVNGTQDAYSNPYGATALRNNHLSKGIPSVLDRMQNVSILRGNLFECALDQHDLPQHDSGRLTYSCGSDAFNVPYYIYVGMLFTGACTVVLVYLRLHSPPTSSISAAVQGIRRLVLNWASVVERYEATAVSNQLSSLPLQRYKQVQQLFDLLCAQAALCSLYIIVVGLPLYATLSHFYGTHAYTYAWSASAAYLSGPTALALQMAFLCVLVGLLVSLHVSLVRTMTRVQLGQLQCQPAATNPTTGSNQVFWESLKTLSALFLVNTVVVAAANTGFVVAAAKGDALAQTFAQIALSVFKLLWSNFGLIYLMRWAQQHLSALDTKSSNTGAATHAFFGLQLFVQLYNLIIVPCIVTALLSPDCFNSAIAAAPTVTTHFSYLYCAEYTGSAYHSCVYYATASATSSYDPPFTYSYQCSSSLITYYAPTFVYAGLIATFVNPLLSLAQRAAYLRVPEQSPWKRALMFFVPKIQRPGGAAAVPFDKPYNPLRPYWDANHRCILLLTYLGVLLTFGLVFPPLVLVMLTTMYSAVWLSRLEVGRFLSEALADNVHKYSEIIEAECKDVGSVPQLHQAARVLLCAVCAFYAPFLFDTLGDAQGARRSFWVLIVTPLLPAVLFVIAECRALCRLTPHANGTKDVNEHHSADVDIELYSADQNKGSACAKDTTSEIDVAPVLNALIRSSRKE